jgi:hypothetical protein
LLRNWNQLGNRYRMFHLIFPEPLTNYCPDSPVLYRPENSGWLLTEGKFVLNWLEGEMAPSCLEDIVLCQNEEDREVEDGSSNDDSADDSEDD